MCGIVGKYYFNVAQYDSSDLKQMKNAIHHRGPDSSGSFEDNRLVLGFQRLSIIDTATGHQPLYSEKKDIVLMANGEIYNYKELKAVLVAKGHSFKTKSDCEVIIHLYEEYGNEFVAKLNGMFAFTLYDCKNELLFIARDRVGIKPMYFYRNDYAIIFGSEIKGILAAKEARTIEEENVLGEYLCFRYLVNRRTFFSGIQSLDPGTYIELSPAGCKFITYSNLSVLKRCFTEHDLLEKLDNALCSSVDRQMVADVPLGTQLSGGVDSSLVSALAANYHPGLKTFTVGFNENEFDETPFAKMLAQSVGLEYHEVRIGNKEFSDILPKAIWFHDEPLCHANSVQMYLLCKYAREHVKVMLTGEGADELFAGYPRYMIARIGELCNRFSGLSGPLKMIMGALHFRKAQKIAYNLGLNKHELVLWNAIFTSEQKASWLLDIKSVDVSSRLEMLHKTWNNDLTLFENLLIYERKTYLQPILARQDKMSMAASMESRVPVLDNEILALADSIPYRWKIRNFTPKHIFKKMAVRHVPRKIVYKKKVGFGVPIDDWLRDISGLGRYLDMLLDMSTGMNTVNKVRLEKIVEEHRKGTINHGDVLWPMVNYVIWKNIFFD